MKPREESRRVVKGREASQAILGLIGLFWAYLVIFWPKSAHLGALGPGFRPFLAYFKPKLAHFGCLGPFLAYFKQPLIRPFGSLGPFWGSSAWIWAILGEIGPVFGPLLAYFKPNLAHLGVHGLDLCHFGHWPIWGDLDLAISGGLGPVFGPVFVL